MMDHDEFDHYLRQIKQDENTSSDDVDADTGALTSALLAHHNVVPSTSARERMWQRAVTRHEDASHGSAPIGLSMDERTSDVIVQLQQVNSTLRRTTLLMVAINIIVVVCATVLVFAVLNRETPSAQVVIATPAASPGLVGSENVVVPNAGSWNATAPSTLQAFRPVVLAVQPMPPGTHITEDMLTIIMWPVDLDLPGPTFNDIETVVGMYVRGHTSAFEPILGFNMSEEGPPVPPADDVLDNVVNASQI